MTVSCCSISDPPDIFWYKTRHSGELTVCHSGRPRIGEDIKPCPPPKRPRPRTTLTTLTTIKPCHKAGFFPEHAKPFIAYKASGRHIFPDIVRAIARTSIAKSHAANRWQSTSVVARRPAHPSAPAVNMCSGTGKGRWQSQSARSARPDHHGNLSDNFRRLVFHERR